MLIDAEYDHGQVRWQQPFRLRHERFRVRIEIPDQEIVGVVHASAAELPGTAPLQGEAAEFKRLTDVLFGGDYRYQPAESDREILEQVLSENYA